MKRKMLLVGIGALLIAALFSISIVSCEREVVTTTVVGNISNDNVVGKWKYYEEWGNNGYYRSKEVVFKADYTGTIVSNGEDGSGEYHRSETFRYLMTSNESGYIVEDGHEHAEVFVLLDGKLFYDNGEFTKE